MKKSFLFIGILLKISFFTPENIQAQCPNLDFSMGNFTNWQAYTGSCFNGVDTIYSSQPISGKHTIMDGAQLTKDDELFDERCPEIKKVLDGFSFSAKLGNEVGNVEVEAIEYSMTIDSSNSLLLLHFAFVLENSQEQNPNERPRFTIQIRDNMGNPLNMGCTTLEFIADTGLQNLTCTGEFVAQDWTTIGFNLDTLIGQTIRIYFEVRDGSQGNNFGYAYIAAGCSPSNITLGYCANGSWDARLRAPNGFAQYKWTKSSDPFWELNFQNSPGFIGVADGDVFTCVMTSGLDTNCKATYSVGFVYTILNANFSLIEYDTCTRTATFADLSTVINSGKGDVLWEIPKLGVTSKDSLFTYTFPDPDDNNPVDYLVRLSVEATNACRNTYDGKGKKEETITIYPSPKIQISGVEQMCVGDTAYLKAMPIRHAFIDHTWSWEDTNGVIQTLVGDSIEIYAPGVYILTSEDDEGCFARDTFTVAKSKLLMDVRITDVNCYGEATGELTYEEIMGGTGGFQWIKWNLGDTVVEGSAMGATYSNLPAGIYSIEALDSRNCLLSDEFEIKQNDSLKIVATSYPATNELNNGKLKLNATGGKSPYQYEIKKEDNTFVSSSDTAWNLPAGIYHIQVTDAVQCITSDTINVSHVLGISDISNVNSIRIFPNPVVNGKLNIEVSEFFIDEGEPIIITDMTGKIVQTSVFCSIETELNVSSLASGLYVIQIGNIKGKFIKR